MVVLLLAAMISATLSTVSGTLNVFANVVTFDFYRPVWLAKVVGEDTHQGRTCFYLPLWRHHHGNSGFNTYLGGAEKVGVWVLTAIIPPLFIPSLWGLFSRRVSSRSVWWALGIADLIAVIVKLDWIPGQFIQTHINLINAFNGFGVPVIILLIVELFKRGEAYDSGWERLSRMYGKTQKAPDPLLMEKIKKRLCNIW